MKEYNCLEPGIYSRNNTIDYRLTTSDCAAFGGTPEAL